MSEMYTSAKLLTIIRQGLRDIGYQDSLLKKEYLMCTQLSKHCAVVSPRSEFHHLTNLPAAGRINDSCCGGTILVTINGDQTTYLPLHANHRNFVADKNAVPTPLCLTFKKETAS